MPREVLRIEHLEPVSAPPETRNEHLRPCYPRPPVMGIPYMRAPRMTYQERRSMEVMAWDLHDAVVGLLIIITTLLSCKRWWMRGVIMHTPSGG
ncbi:unnamed protein product [Lactuca virosa]|uniref:Uncharacterized protein n=1 Tax=Lactuca virosa TaxID=75947 RepID=A0AAU9NC55_9ASTR|nr:unnamed protein product [Lactuca virosa]